VKRSIFIDDRVFSIATDRMKVQRRAKLGEDVADIALAPRGPTVSPARPQSP
jgi:hypothetical protein